MISHRCFILFTIVSAVFLLAGLSTPAIANEVSFGILGGFCGANQDFETAAGDIERDVVGGFNIGMFADYKLSPVWSARPSLTYVQKGSSIEVEETTVDYPLGTGNMLTFKDRYHYLSLALPIKANLAARGFVPYFLVGPRVDLKLSVYSPLKPAEGLVGSDGESMFDGEKSVVLGSEFGLGFSIDLNSGKAIILELVAEIDYTKALEYESISIKNEAGILRLGFRF